MDYFSKASSYFFIFLRRYPPIPTTPVPKSSMETGSGTGAPAAPVSAVKISHPTSCDDCWSYLATNMSAILSMVCAKVDPNFYKFLSYNIRMIYYIFLSGLSARGMGVKHGGKNTNK